MPTELTRDEIDDLFATQTVGRLGMIDESVPYVVPLSYAYREGALYAHSGQGRKVRALRSNPEVCFEVDEVASLERWRSAIGWGSFEQLIGADARAGMDILLDRYRPLVSAAPADAGPGAELGMMRTLDIPRLPEAGAELGRPSGAAVVFRISLHTVSGRREGEW